MHFTSHKFTMCHDEIQEKKVHRILFDPAHFEAYKRHLNFFRHSFCLTSSKDAAEKSEEE